MASRGRRYRSRRLQALQHNPELLVIRPAPPSAGLNDLQSFNLSTALMTVHKDSFTSHNITQQGGLHRRKTIGQQRFRFHVLAKYGPQCAVCSISHPQLLKAAHMRGKADQGCDDWRNGIVLCATHHDASLNWRWEATLKDWGLEGLSDGG